MERLADGIQYYLHGPEGGYHPKMNRIANLKLTHFQDTSSQDLTEEILQVNCTPFSPDNICKSMFTQDFPKLKYALVIPSPTISSSFPH